MKTFTRFKVFVVSLYPVSYSYFDMDRNELKQMVVEQAQQAFMQKGIKAVKMDDLAAQMSISKRTLYEWFGDKKNLLKECIRMHYEKEREAMNGIVATSENILEIILKSYERRLEQLHQINFQYYQEVWSQPDLVACYHESEELSSQRICDAMRSGVKQGLFREDVNYQVFDLLFSNQFRLLYETDAWKKFPPAEIFRSIVLVNVRGILTEKGQRLMETFLENKR